VYQRRRPRDCPKEYNREAKSALAVVNNYLEVRHWRRTSRQFGQTISLLPACAQLPEEAAKAENWLTACVRLQAEAAKAANLLPACARLQEEAAKAENWLTACARLRAEAAKAANLLPACARPRAEAAEEVKR
jgi:hypothetical protein